MTVERYLAIHYMIPEKPAVLPLPDEAFTRLWKEAEGEAALRFLADAFKLPVEHFQLQEPAAVQIRFTSTLGGRLPVIYAGCTGRLTFYCKILPPEDQANVYRAVDRVLDTVESEVAALSREKATHYDILAHLTGTSIAERAEA